MFHSRQNGHCGSSKTVRVTGADALPTVSPRCGTPVNVDTASGPPPPLVDVETTVVVGGEEELVPATTITTTTTTTAAATAPPSSRRRLRFTATGCRTRPPTPPWNPADRGRL